jgi:hypothetical protein
MAGHRVPYVSDKLAAKVIGAGEKVSAYLLLTLPKRMTLARPSCDTYFFHEVRTPLNSLTMGID